MSDTTGHPDHFEAKYARALAFVEGLELPRPPRVRRSSAATTAAAEIFEAATNKAAVVGADIVSLVAGLRPEQREIVVNCSLLAQLAANKRVPEREEIHAWYEAYFDTLTHVGWIIQERGFSEHHEQGLQFETNQAILSVASVLLGPATTALAVVQTTLNAMKTMADGPWMTLFKRESQAAKTARFQVTVAEPGTEGGAVISLMAFELDAKSTLVQVLFFKFHSTDVTLSHASGKVTVDMNLLEQLRPAIAQKVAKFTARYIEALPV
jgi:hypothetical protein